MDIRIPLPDWATGFTANAAAKVLDAMATAYLPYYALHPLPPLRRSGVVFRPEPGHGSGVDEFANPWLVYKRGWGDCDDLVCWRLVELRYRGHDVSATRAEWVGDGVHALVRLANGDTEDISILCGAR